MGGTSSVQGSSSSLLSVPHDVWVGEDYNIYVSDTMNNRIQRFSPGEKKGVTVVSKISYPQHIHLDEKSNTLYIAEYNGHRLSKWNLVSGTGMAIVHNCTTCTGIFVSSRDGSIYVSEQTRYRVVKYPSTGDLNSHGVVVAGITDEGGSSVKQLKQPNGIFVDVHDNVYVCDYGNKRIQKWSPGASEGVTIVQNVGAIDIVADDAGMLYFTDDTNHAVLRLKENGNTNYSVIAGNRELPLYFPPTYPIKFFHLFDRRQMDQNRHLY